MSAKPAAGTVVLRILFVTLVVLVGALVGSLVALRPETPEGTEVSLDRGVGMLASPEGVAEVTFLDQDARVIVEDMEGGRVWSAYPSGSAASAEFVTQAAQADVAVTVDQQFGKRVLGIFGQFIVPLLLLANLFGIFILLARGGASQVKDLFAFSRLTARRSSSGSAADGGERTTFTDVAAADEAVEELAELRDYLRAPGRYRAMGARPPKGILLYGPPGCGKTLLARALAGEANVPFYFISGSEFVESLVGVGAARVRDLFAQALASAPAIVFVDELDAAARRRGAGVGGGHDEREQTLNELLVQMDGFSPNAGVMVIGATNRSDILDPALLRPGRFDRRILVQAPDRQGRVEVLKLHAKGHRLGADADLEQIARATPGFSGADLAAVLNEASLLAVRRGSSAAETVDLVEGVQRVLAGPKRRTRVLSEAELHRLAYHEAGHAVVAHDVDYPAELQRISLVARGQEAARTHTVPRSDQVVLTAAELRAELTILMAGTAAETLASGQLSTAVEGDLEAATDLARRYVGRYGMSDTVGRIRVLRHEGEVFLGRDLLAGHDTSSHTLQTLDGAVADLIAEAERHALEILQQRRRALDAIAAALMERETLEEPELAELLATSQTSQRRSGTKPRRPASRQQKAAPRRAST